jgi:biotin-dependent carboxylase-like uncharacterized protein
VTEVVLHAVAPSPFSTVQDFGRVGWRRYGVTGAGAMDVESHAVANALVGNAVEAATVEFAHGGGEWTISGAAARIAVAGGSFAASIDGRAVATGSSAVLRPGARLQIGGARDAVWGYLAVSGGIRVERELGSRATYVRAGMGGLEGRKLEAGDRLPLQPPPVIGPECRMDRAPSGDPAAPIRVVLGPQDDYFTAESIAVFLSSHYQVTWQADRMGYRLEGPPLEHSRGFNIVSDAILPGSIQVPGNGRPIVLLRDAQTTGGYPKVATIISADLGRFAQLRPLSRMRFTAVTPDAAQLLRREFITRVQATGLHTRAG